jgi:GDP-D-mannose dehydratase
MKLTISSVTRQSPSEAGLEHRVSFEQLVEQMVEEDLNLVKQQAPK